MKSPSSDTIIFFVSKISVSRPCSKKTRRIYSVMTDCVVSTLDLSRLQYNLMVLQQLPNSRAHPMKLAIENFGNQ